jgi:hypothetical protein
MGDTKKKVSELIKTSIITLTFGCCSENHVGMKKQGNGLSKHGFTVSELKEMKKKFEDLDCKCILKRLNDALEDDSDSDSDVETDEAYFLIIRNGIDALINETKFKDKTSTDVFKEHVYLPWDTKYFDTRRKKILNKHARYNLCYDDESIEADYQNKQGTVIAYDDVPITKAIRGKFEKYFGKKAKELETESNYYYDKTCGIGWHGDGERKKVIAMRLGASNKLYFQWFHKSKPIGEIMSFVINGGDMYVMSELATGYNWKKKNIKTLRHSTGSDKYTKIKK